MYAIAFNHILSHTSNTNIYNTNNNYIYDKNTSQHIHGLSLYSRFIYNYNIIAVLLIVPFVVSIILLVVAKTVYNSNGIKYK